MLTNANSLTVISQLCQIISIQQYIRSVMCGGDDGCQLFLKLGQSLFGLKYWWFLSAIVLQLTQGTRTDNGSSEPKYLRVCWERCVPFPSGSTWREPGGAIQTALNRHTIKLKMFFFFKCFDVTCLNVLSFSVQQANFWFINFTLWFILVVFVNSSTTIAIAHALWFSSINIKY